MGQPRGVRNDNMDTVRPIALKYFHNDKHLDKKNTGRDKQQNF